MLYIIFFNHLEISYEDYNIENNSKFHYLSLYLNLLKKLNIKIENKDHYLPLLILKNFKIKNDYVLFHIDKSGKSSLRNNQQSDKKNTINFS